METGGSTSTVNYTQLYTIDTYYLDTDNDGFWDYNYPITEVGENEAYITIGGAVDKTFIITYDEDTEGLILTHYGNTNTLIWWIQKFQ
jgi:hypothetical protein